MEHLTTKNNWYSIPIDEQETIINFDYFDHKIILYTTNKATSNRLQKKIGEPDEITKTNGLISGTTWNLKFEQRETIKKAISLGSLLTMNQSKSIQGKVEEE